MKSLVVVKHLPFYVFVSDLHKSCYVIKVCIIETKAK